MAELIYFNNKVRCTYEVASHFHSNYPYIREIFNSLIRLIPPSKRIFIVVRGTSGTILAGAVGSLLKTVDREFEICVSRKDSESSHGFSLDNLYQYDSSRDIIVVMDDFIKEGNTVKAIIRDLDHNSLDHNRELPKVFGILCISNSWSEEHILESYRVEYIKRFETILCNSPIDLED